MYPVAGGHSCMDDNVFGAPSISAEKLRGALLCSSREELIRMVFPNGADRICEVGVAYGDFSQFLIETLEPEVFVGADTFRIHTQEVFWGRPTAERFKGATHRQFFENRFKDTVSELTVLEGQSNETLGSLPDEFFDLIYIDAAHDYTSVKKDAIASGPKLKANGALIFDDYTIFDPYMNVPYGVVRAVNEFVEETDWRVVGMSLQAQMFCDIALRRR